MPVKKEQSPSLSELQLWLRWILTEPKGVASALSEPLPISLNDCLSFIAETPDLLKEKRLNVYAEGYFLRLVDSLSNNFPKLFQVLGENKFYQLAARYFHAYSSTSYNIKDVGCHLAGFLEKDVFTAKQPFLSSLAALEWTVLQSFHADDVSKLEINYLQTLSEPVLANARLHLDPSLYFFNFDWPVHEISELTDLSALEFPLQLEKSPCRLIVYRKNYAVFVENLNAFQFEILNMIKQGFSLEEIFETLSENLDDISEMPPVIEWFSGWAATGIICKVEVRD